MYESFYRLSANPFRLAPDSRFCFSHSCYDEARAYLEFAFRLGEGFVIFTGRPGTGKTTLAQSFLGSLEKTRAIGARIAVSNLNAANLLRAVAYAYNIDVEGMDMASVLRQLEKYFVQQVRSGKRILLIIDDAQGLSQSALEELRILADLQLDSQFLMQIFLVGQEKLRELMVAPDMEQFQQRVTGTCKLVPLSEQETRDYMEYRLCQVDWSGDPELTGAAVHAIYQFSEGIPRHINKLCTRLLLHGLLESRHVLDDVDVLDVAEGLKEEQLAPLQTEYTELDSGARIPRAATHVEQADDAYAALALRAPETAIKAACRDVKPERPKYVERQAKKTYGSELRTVGDREEKAGALQNALNTEFYRQGVTGILTVPGSLKRYLDSAAVFGMSAVVALLLIITVVNDDEFDEINNLRVSRIDTYETLEQLPLYRDGEYEEHITYEDPDFVRENRARRSARLAAGEMVAAQPADNSMQAPGLVLSSGAKPIAESGLVEKESVAGKSVSVVADEPDLDDALSSIAAIEVFKPPGVDSRVTHAPPDNAVVEPPSIDTVVDENRRDDDPMSLVRADSVDLEENASLKIDAMIPGAGADQVAAGKVKQDKIGRLLSLARRSLQEYRLLLPEDNNAYEYYRQIDALDPGNREAAKGIRKITERYAMLAERALERGDDTMAVRYINRGLRVRPDDDTLLALQVAMFEPEAERVYVPPVTPSQPPPQASTTLFSRIREIIEKDQLGVKNASLWHDEDDVW